MCVPETFPGIAWQLFGETWAFYSVLTNREWLVRMCRR
jgi:hypothetical protein